MSVAFLSLTITIVVILLPLVPAILLFRHLPSEGQVSGTFQGMAYKFGGAAAGYFAVLFAMGYLVTPQLNRQTAALEMSAKAAQASLQEDKYESWRLVGKIALDPQEPNHVPTDVVVRMVPPNFQVLPGGLFSFDVPVRVQQDRRNFPNLVFDHPGYTGFTLCLDSKELCDFGYLWIDQTHDLINHTVTLGKPVILTKMDPSTPGQQPVAVAISVPQ